MPNSQVELPIDQRKDKGLVKYRLKKLCDQFDLDFPMDLHFTLAESENMEIIRNKIGGGDELDLSAREMNKCAEA